MSLNSNFRKKFNWTELLPAPVIGVDEVGRGCLAGRVYAAAVILQSKKDIRFYADSKTLSGSRREELFLSIQRHHKFGLGFASVDEIDRINILQASLLAMKRAIENLGVTGGHVIVDGNCKIPGLIGFTQTALIKGDSRAAPVGAASIVAKVTRDKYMIELEREFPGYGFEEHKGYATEKHRKALSAQGVSVVHRKTFAPVRDMLSLDGKTFAARP